jgi:SNARE protein 1
VGITFEFSVLGAEDNLRRRKQKSTGEDLDALLKYHHSMQEKIADDMLSLTRNLKEQSQLASSIIKKDTEVCY